jgi:DNA-binding MarR family transcriptional regulator
MDVENAPERLRTLPSWLLGQLSIEARAEVGGALARSGLHRSQYALLAALAEFGAASQADLGERSGLDRSDVVRWIDDLAERGFVQRTRDPEDRRRNVVALTASGRRTLTRLDGEIAKAQERLLERLSATDRNALVRLLRRALGA